MVSFRIMKLIFSKYFTSCSQSFLLLLSRCAMCMIRIGKRVVRSCGMRRRAWKGLRGSVKRVQGGPNEESHPPDGGWLSVSR